LFAVAGVGGHGGWHKHVLAAAAPDGDSLAEASLTADWVVVVGKTGCAAAVFCDDVFDVFVFHGFSFFFLQK